MIREYAIDPAAIYRNLDSLQRFLTDFRAENGRVIAGIPRAWKNEQRAHIRAMELSDIAKRRLLDDIDIIATTSLFSGINIPDNLNSWIEKARYTKRNLSLNAIISTTTNLATGEFNYERLIENEPSDWNIPQTISVARTAHSLATAIENSLKIASTVIFVEPYFDPRENRFKEPLAAFISKIENNKCNCRKIYIHTSANNISRENLQQGLEQNITPILPEHFIVEAWLWQSAKLHDRFVLTKNVGYAFGHGLDEVNNPDAMHVNINRLAESARKAEFTKFSTAANRIGDPIIIQGEPRS